ncbi:MULTISPECIES: hypothetical protein [Corynebacterium]|uniref:hypothetical protein n=1 Tax=Corynebacterium TaxID=1716 RepID=UPI0016527C99|nr:MULTISPECIES: hypothetical protein [Corynebacterium]MBC6798046.1 hypothetical protein [Corynebacterium sp. LK31]MDK7145100.1 hypothetical protein [Corynebacterium amycolatum]
MFYEILAQQQSGGGQGSAGITNAINNTTQQLQIIGGAVAALAFIAAVIIGLVIVIRGGNIQRLIGPLGAVLGGAFILGIGTAAVGWLISLGQSVSG